MRPGHVELIVAIAEAGSLGAAAQVLGRTQPALTKALKQAEGELGAQLFHRGAHGALPTAEGQRVIERCRRILRDLHALDEDVAQARGAVTGRIDVIVSPLAAIKILPPVLARLRRRFAGIHLEVTSGHAEAAFRRLKTAEADYVLGPAPAPGTGAGLSAEPLLTTGITLLTGARSRHATTTDPAELARADWVMIGRGERQPLYVPLLQALGQTPPEPVVKSDSILAVMSILEASDLLCSFPSLAVPDMLRRWDVVALPVDTSPVAVDIALTRARDRIPTPAALAFADLVREEAAALSAPA
ncbi:LysR family transcriptional regulator [Rhodobacterales bacterium HKCCE2091]|nr:LysR family transcriptional regulator [Rhodobacterales bacterium HKCCE2091]